MVHFNFFCVKQLHSKLPKSLPFGIHMLFLSYLCGEKVCYLLSDTETQAEIICRACFNLWRCLRIFLTQSVEASVFSLSPAFLYCYNSFYINMW